MLLGLFVASQIVLGHRSCRVAHQGLDLLDRPAGLAEQGTAQRSDLVESRRALAADACSITRGREGSADLLWQQRRVVRAFLGT